MSTQRPPATHSLPRPDFGGRGALGDISGGAAPRCAGESPAGGDLIRGIAWGLVFELLGVAVVVTLLFLGAALA